MKDRHFVKGAVWNTLGSMMYGVNSFIMLAVVGRLGTAAEAGYFGIAFTTAQLLYIVGLLGTNHYQQTDYHEKYAFYDYKQAKKAACFFMIFGCVLVMGILRFSKIKIIYTSLLTVLMMVNAVGDLYQNLFFQKNKLDLSGRALFTRTFWSLLAFAAAAFATGNILFAIFVQIITNVAVTGYYAYRYVPVFVPDVGNYGNKSRCRSLIAECLPLFASLFLMNLVINTSKYGIEFLMGDAQQGYYNMIFILVQVINLCSQFLFKPLLNQYAKTLEAGRYAAFYKMMRGQMGMIFLFTVFCAVMAYCFGVQVLGAVYQKDLSVYRDALVFVVAGGGIFAAGQFIYYIYVILREQKKIMCVYTAGFAGSVPATYFMIQAYGLDGAALSFIVTQLSILLLYICGLFCILRQKKHRGKAG